MSNKKFKAINIGEPTKILFWFLIVFIFISLFSYAYLIRSMTLNIVYRQDTENNISLLNSKVLELESRYIKDKNSITMEKAQNLGFVAVSKQKFVKLDSGSTGLSLLTTGL